MDCVAFLSQIQPCTDRGSAENRADIVADHTRLSARYRKLWAEKMDTEGNQTSRGLSYLKSVICAEFKHAFIGTTAAILTIIQIIWIIYTGLSEHLQFEEAPPLAKGQIVPNSNFVALAILICALFQVAVSFFWFKVRSWTSGLPVSWKLTTDVAYSLIAEAYGDVSGRNCGWYAGGTGPV
jgi:hypothetical protein